MARRTSRSSLPSLRALAPGIVAFLLIAGAVFGLLQVWHHQRLGETPPIAPDQVPAAADVPSFRYTADTPLAPGRRYVTGRVLRALVATSPASADPIVLANLWREPDRALQIVERGTFEVLDRVRSEAQGAVWYQVRIPDDCLDHPRGGASIVAWVEDSQLIGAPFEEHAPR